MEPLSRLRRGRLVLDVRDEGPPGGDAVVLLHGFPQDASCWDRVAPRLHAAGMRTLAPDQRGYSPGARPRGRSAYKLRWLVADVAALLDAAGLSRCHLVGHDWGGAVAWAAAAAWPGRVASLTVVSTPHPQAYARSLVRSGQALRSWYIGVFQLPRLPEAAVRPVLAGTLRRSGLPAADAARYAARMQEPGALTAAINWYRAIPLYGARLRPAGPVPVPTTYLWGARDPALGRAAARATADHVVGDYAFVESDGGHWLPETRPEEVAGAILARVRAPG
ncbi:alpha/beta fold hydrolase [Georgenia sp. AZ-5]|uniref:alpha/beta fold hydrolase n=1 Tax=Georgenia sp. AZ-5 TaxID=3367526 RepID=UPI003754A9CD